MIACTADTHEYNTCMQAYSLHMHIKVDLELLYGHSLFAPPKAWNYCIGKFTLLAFTSGNGILYYSWFITAVLLLAVCSQLMLIIILKNLLL